MSIVVQASLDYYLLKNVVLMRLLLGATWNNRDARRKVIKTFVFLKKFWNKVVTYDYIKAIRKTAVVQQRN